MSFALWVMITCGPVTLEQGADTRGHDRGSNIATDHGLMLVAPVSHARVVVAEHFKVTDLETPTGILELRQPDDHRGHAHQA